MRLKASVDKVNSTLCSQLAVAPAPLVAVLTSMMAHKDRSFAEVERFSLMVEV